MLLRNGRIYTMDPRGGVVDALVVRDGRIAFGGRSADVNPAIGEAVVDLGGRAVVPGLTDAHAHLAILARSRMTLDVAPFGSEEEVARAVGAEARRLGAGEWIVGRGWDQTRWPSARFPTRHSLDRAAPANPVALVRVDGHATWASSAALAAADVTRHTSDPPGGLLLRSDEGELTGVLIDTAQELVRAVEPRPSADRLDRAVREVIGECLRKGLTGIHEMGADLDALACYRRLVDRGQFPFRNYVAVSGKKAWSEYRERGPEVLGDRRVVVGALKLWLDGALGSRGAALHHPYCDDPKNLGLLLIPPEEVVERAREAAPLGFQLCVHAIGDRANTLVLDAFERVLPSLPPEPRLRVEHAQILAPADVPRFRRLGVLPSMQPTHCISDMRWVQERLGPDRLEGAYAWRSLLDSGTIIAAGSDFPVEDPSPFHGIHAAVTRRPLVGDDSPWQPEQRMTRDQAIRAFTIWNAVASRQERKTGSLEVGKQADLVVLSDDVFHCADERLRAITPLATIVAGEVVAGRLPS